MHDGATERQGVSPFLSRYAQRRTGSDRLPGRYCSELQMWLVDTDHGPLALIDTSEGRAATETVTRVLAEQTDSSHATQMTGTQPVTTVTAVAMEQDDWVADRTALHRLATITEVAAEQTDK